MRRAGEHAVVLGGSMAGLAAAAALADRFGEVTVVERDDPPALGGHRRGVPQGRHGHALLPAGLEALAELLPELVDDLRVAGAEVCDRPEDLRFHVFGGMVRQVRTGHDVVSASRPLIEGIVRARVAELANVRFLDAHDVRGWVLSPDRSQVTGVRIQPRDGTGGERVVDADLVVDATGRGSRTPRWLAEAGYPQPAVEEVHVGVHYTTRLFQRRGVEASGARQVLVAGGPGVHRGAFAQAIEGDRWLVTLVGVLGLRPPTDLEGFVDFAASLSVPDVHRIVAGAEPIGDAVTASYPASVRRRYERLRRFPGRLVVVGDAACSFNPTYGQGMSVAALEARTLAELVDGDLASIGPRFFRRAKRLVDVPWDQSVGADLRDPEVSGSRTLRWRLVTAYLERVFPAAQRDPVVALALLRVIGLLDGPETLLHPRIAARVLRRPRRDRAAPVTEVASSAATGVSIAP